MISSLKFSRNDTNKAIGNVFLRVLEEIHQGISVLTQVLEEQLSILSIFNYCFFTLTL